MNRYIIKSTDVDDLVLCYSALETDNDEGANDLTYSADGRFFENTAEIFQTIGDAKVAIKKGIRLNTKELETLEAEYPGSKKEMEDLKELLSLLRNAEIVEI